MTPRFGPSRLRFWPFKGQFQAHAPSKNAEALQQGSSKPTLSAAEPAIEQSASGMSRDERGLASIEYVIVLVAVSLGVAASLVVIGSTVVDSFDWQVSILGLPVP